MGQASGPSRHRSWAEGRRLAVLVAGRSAAVFGAYGIAAAATFAAVLILRHSLQGEALKSALAFIFVAGLAAGLEPGTVKAAALAERRGGAGRLAATSGPTLLAAGAAKALIAAPFLALAWRFADPGAPLTVLAVTPLAAFAGFSATDFRGLFDLEGRHALAIGLKQGSLALGVATFTTALLAGAALPLAAAAACLMRIALMIGVARRRRPGPGLEPGAGGVLALLADVRWAEMAGASVLGAAGGSADRLLGLRYLAAADYAGYFLTYEVFSRFWLLPYLLSPILFARTARGLDSDRFAAGARAVTALAGAAFLLAVAAALVSLPGPVARLLGRPPSAALLAFASGVVVSAFVQLRMPTLQGHGRVRLVLGLTAFSALTSMAIFFAFLRQMGAEGLLWAWPAKALVDLAAVSLAARIGTSPAGAGAL